MATQTPSRGQRAGTDSGAGQDLGTQSRRNRTRARFPTAFYVMVLPAFVLFLVFHTIPVIQGIYYSFTDSRHRGVLRRPTARAAAPGGVGLMSTPAIETGTVAEPTIVAGRRRRRLFPAAGSVNWWLTALLIVLALTIAIPLYFAVVTALKTTDQLGGAGFGLPTDIRWANFADAWRLTDFPTAALNSAIITVGAVVLTLLTNSMVAYAIARNMNRPLFKGLYF